MTEFLAFFPLVCSVDIFQDTAPFANSVLDGYNVCIFAYGQTGTGKTFTMEGTKEARGVNFRTLEELFRIIKDREKLYRYDISVSVLEVYNEQIRDLLVVGSQSGAASKRSVSMVFFFFFIYSKCFPEVVNPDIAAKSLCERSSILLWLGITNCFSTIDFSDLLLHYSCLIKPL